jgi:hypothetical protein
MSSCSLRYFPLARVGLARMRFRHARSARHTVGCRRSTAAPAVPHALTSLHQPWSELTPGADGEKGTAARRNRRLVSHPARPRRPPTALRSNRPERSPRCVILPNACSSFSRDRPTARK